MLTLLLVGVFVLYKPENRFDKKVTFSRKETRPYATNICFTTLPLMFKNAKVEVNTKEPYYWIDKDSSYKQGGQMMFLLSKQFNPNKIELDWLYSFVSNGNYVFIICPRMNETANEYFKIDFDYHYYRGDEPYNDSVKTKLIPPYYKCDSSYYNAGFTSSNYFSKYDSSNFIALGLNHKNNPNFIKASVNKGAFYFHSDPFLFANYFLLQKHNDEYFQKVISAVPSNVNKIIWDDYFVYKSAEETKQRSPLRLLLQYPSFVWATFLAIILFLLYLAIHIKRKQRFVEPVKELRNDSLYFAETIGRLYFEKGDHANLAKKMSAYFLEHIRNKYLINTSQLNNELVSRISAKSDYPEEATRQLIQTIVDIQVQDAIDQKQLNLYYTQFQNFYKYTL